MLEKDSSNRFEHLDVDEKEELAKREKEDALARKEIDGGGVAAVAGIDENANDMMVESQINATKKGNYSMRISLKEQILKVYDDNNVCIKNYPISTGVEGIGNEVGSMKTPFGKHCVLEKHGNDKEIYTVFKEKDKDVKSRG